MMISLKLWRSLSKPPRRHPLFNYVLLDAKRERPQVTSGFVIWAMMLATIVFVWSVLLKPLTWVILAVFVALNSIYSARWVLRISRALAQEKETRRYDLLASMPIGLLGTSWALSTGVVHRRSSFRWLPYLILVIVVVSFVALCGLSTLTLTMINEISEGENALLQNLAFARDGIVALPFLLLFYIDHIYSILTAIILAQLATIDVRNTVDGQFRALVGFLTVQILLYLASVAFIIFVIPNLFTIVDLSNVNHLIWMSVLGFTSFIALRESVLFLMWRALVRWLDADHKEVALVLKPFYEAESILKESEQARVRHVDATR